MERNHVSEHFIDSHRAWLGLGGGVLLAVCISSLVAVKPHSSALSSTRAS